jgi:NAD(P)-dependent dehydrogenase (short-subunit alcohol dehydrogenase family)
MLLTGKSAVITGSTSGIGLGIHEFATPERIGAVAVFLCSEATAQIRGAALPVDDGWTAQ